MLQCIKDKYETTKHIPKNVIKKIIKIVYERCTFYV